jgi:parallel beta-helix repeat protein
VVVLGTGCATAQTGSPLSVAPDGATVAGKVVSSTGGQIEYWAKYGPTTAYGSESPHQTVSATKAQVITVFPAIAGLQRAARYHYRVCARDSQQQGGPGCGQDRILTTQSAGCGETVTVDVRLTGDLFCPQQPGFVIGADGVDVDLAGFGIDGAIAVGGGGPRGIDNTGGHDDLTVRNGTVGGFGTAFEATDASRNRILHVSGSTAGTAVLIDGGADNEIRHSNIHARGSGIVVNSLRFVLADTAADGSFGSAIAVAGDGARLVRNRTDHSGGQAFLSSGIFYTGSGARIADNRIDGRWDNGNILVAGTDNLLVGNEASGGVRPTLPSEPPATGDGIFVSDASGGTVLRRNTASGSEGDGIEVRSAGVGLEGNGAFSNGDLGIDGVAGVIDLGGNRASGNGNALQCRNVFCP